MTGSVQISVLASGANGRPVGRHLLRRLVGADTAEALSVGERRYESERMTFRTVRAREYEEEEEPAEAMSKAVDEALTNLARFLATQDAATLGELTELGFEVRIYISIWMNENQFELTLPTALLRESGRLNWPLDLISNDFSVEEVLAFGGR